MTLLRAGGSDFISQMVEKVIFAGAMHMTKQHIAVRVVRRFVKRNGIMRQDDMPAGIRDFLLVSNVLKATL